MFVAAIVVVDDDGEEVLFFCQPPSFSTIYIANQIVRK